MATFLGFLDFSNSWLPKKMQIRLNVNSLKDVSINQKWDNRFLYKKRFEKTIILTTLSAKQPLNKLNSW